MGIFSLWNEKEKYLSIYCFEDIVLSPSKLVSERRLVEIFSICFSWRLVWLFVLFGRGMLALLYLGCFYFRIYTSWLFSRPCYITYVQFFSMYSLRGSVISKIEVSLLSFWASVIWSNEQMCVVRCLQERGSVSCFGLCLFLYGQ